ncbi:MAG: hypothetical protein ING75_17395 [Rhodocyclaceae bacterium]|nr:hypothetical protein [Rhodocyclaceae bacterium]
MKTIRCAAVFLHLSLASQLASAANAEQCSRIFQDKDSKEMCEAVSFSGTKLTDDELREKVEAVLAEIATSKRKSADLNARRDAAITKLERESKSTALRLKGLYPGITLEKADEYHPGIANFCRDASALRDSLFECNVMTGNLAGPQSIDTLDTLAGQRVKMWAIRGKGNVIWQILVLLPSDSARDVGAALAEKYKSGTIATTTVTNRMGAKFENVTRAWKSGDLSLVVERYGPSLDSGTVMFTSARAPKLKDAPKTKDL